MDALRNVGLANALAVLVLAPLVAIAGRLLKRPALTHALWLILLLKLVTPPWVDLPIVPDVRPDPSAVAPQIAPVVEEDGAAPEVFEVAGAGEAAVVEPEPASKPRSFAMPPWPTLATWGWLAGSSAWLLLASWRVARFARSLRWSEPADDALQGRVDEWSSRIGLRRPPEVRLVPGRISPMVWAPGGRPRLILPGAFWKRLDADQQAAIVIHELAHLRRGDHRVRLLEVAATGLFWWHPALWWARRGLHEAEEQCCDLWVVWAMPASARSYAATLVDAVDFLCEGRTPLPAGASGMGQVQDLSRRIGMIMRGTTPRTLSRPGWLAMLGLTALLLPLRPSLSQQSKPEEVPAATPAAKPASDPLADPDPTPNADEDPSSGLARQTLKAAEARLRWSEQMFAKNYVSQAQLTADQLAVEAARRAIQDEGNARADAVAKARDEVEQLKGQMALRDAQLVRAEAQRGLAKAEVAWIASLKVKDAGVVSKSEAGKAQAELDVAEAGVAEARANKRLLEIQIRQAERKLQALEQPTRPAAPDPSASKNLRQIGRALAGFTERTKQLPAAAITSKAGKPLLSWRVAILPYLEDPAADALYKQFALDEPWDGPRNKALLEKMPSSYQFAGVGMTTMPGMTYAKAIVGDSAAIDETEQLPFDPSAEKAKRTLLVVESGIPTPWTKPEDVAIPFPRSTHAPSLGNGRGFYGLFGDGSVKLLRLPIPPQTLRALAMGSEEATLSTASGPFKAQVRTYSDAGLVPVDPYAKAQYVKQAIPAEVLRDFANNAELAKIRADVAELQQRLANATRVTRNPASDPAVIHSKKKFEELRARYAELLQQQYPGLEDQLARIKIAPAEARDPDQRLSDVEKKLDRVLQELEAIRKEKGHADRERRQAVVDREIQAQFEKGPNEETVRYIYRAYLDREPTADELKDGVEKLSKLGDPKHGLGDYLGPLKEKARRPGGLGP